MREVCIWCGAFCTMPKGYDPKRQFPVCSPECYTQEKVFRYNHSDEKIGERCYAEHGVNPHVMWSKHAKSIKSYHSSPKGKT